jgi:small ligand-binding sensory domain FIST
VTVPFAQGLSRHPDAAEATGEVVGAVLERLPAPPDLALLFCSPHHTDAMGDIAAAVRGLVRPGVLAGATATAVVGGDEEIEDDPAVALWAACLPAPPRPLRLTAAETAGGGLVLAGLSGTTFEPGDVLVLLADPFTLPVDALVEALGGLDPPVPVAGGMASASNRPGGNRLVLDREVVDDGGVGVVLPAAAAPRVVVSQGCRPLGQPMIVTRAEGNLLLDLAGRSALERLEEAVAGASPDERARLAGGLHIGIAVDEHRMTFETGDFLVRAVVGADRDAGALAVGQRVEVGTTVQFHVRDAEAADHDLRRLMAGRDGDGALVFTCNGRGRHLFGAPDHDARVVAEAIDSRAVAGMFCAGEIGPVGTRSYLHSFTASVLLFGDDFTGAKAG